MVWCRFLKKVYPYWIIHFAWYVGRTLLLWRSSVNKFSFLCVISYIGSCKATYCIMKISRSYAGMSCIRCLVRAQESKERARWWRRTSWCVLHIALRSIKMSLDAAEKLFTCYGEKTGCIVEAEMYALCSIDIKSECMFISVYVYGVCPRTVNNSRCMHATVQMHFASTFVSNYLN